MKLMKKMIAVTPKLWALKIKYYQVAWLLSPFLKRVYQYSGKKNIKINKFLSAQSDIYMSQIGYYICLSRKHNLKHF